MWQTACKRFATNDSWMAQRGKCGPQATVAIDAMNFRKAVYVGDLVSVLANVVRVERTSITVHLEAWVLRRKDMPTQSILVTDGNFTYVSIDEQGHPQETQRDGAPTAT